MGDSVQKLTPDMTGTYLVRTQGSEHVWNLDEGWYVRMPGREPHWSMRDFPSQRRIHWVRVDVWPEVGRSFRTILTGDTPWHLSSTIRSIEKVEA